MKNDELLKIIKETTTCMLNIIRLHIQLKGIQSSARLSDSANQLTKKEDEVEASMPNVPRRFSTQEELYYCTLITNIIRLLSINKSNVNEYCTQCLATLLNLLSQDADFVKCECPLDLIELYKDIKTKVELTSELPLDQLSRVMFFVYGNVN